MAPIILKLFRNNLPRPTQKHLSCSFANLMFEGKTKAAICLLTEEAKGGLLHLSDHVDTNLTVRDVLILIDKHPSGQPAHPKSLIEDDPPEVQPVLFDAFMIRSAALRTTGTAGPSGPDDASWRRLCTSFKSASINLCHSLAITAQHLCMKFVDPLAIAPFLACRLIALNKNLGVHPIGIGDTARRITAKLSHLDCYQTGHTGSSWFIATQCWSDFWD